MACQFVSKAISAHLSVGISFPSKLSQIRIGSLTNEFIMRRRMLLEKFLKVGRYLLYSIPSLVLTPADH